MGGPQLPCSPTLPLFLLGFPELLCRARGKLSGWGSEASPYPAIFLIIIFKSGDCIYK